MSKTKALCAIGLVLAVGSAYADDKTATAKGVAVESAAQQKAMEAAYARMREVRAEHKQLAYFDGNWTAKATVWMDPKAPPQESTGSSKNASMWEGRLHTMRYEGEFFGDKFEGFGELGFDNTEGRFFNTWRDSMSTGIWLAYGTYDAAKKAYTFTGKMPDASKPGTKIPVRQVIRVVDDAHYAFEWYETRVGKEAKTMQIEYARQ